MSESNVRPSVTINTYTTLKRIERQQKQTGQQYETATRADLSTDFFKFQAGAGQSQRTRQQQVERGRVLIDLSQIKGPTGSVRGHKNVVRKSLEGIKMASNRHSHSAISENGARLSCFSISSGPANFSSLSSSSNSSKGSPTNSLLQNHSAQFHCQDYLERLLEDEQNLCVAYTTTLGVIRRTFEDSKIMKSILNLNLIQYEERDTYLNQEYKFQLKVRLDSISVPALFVDGQHIGGLAEVESMNENGELQRLLARFKMTKPITKVCMCCGNARFIACPSCNGSRKSTIHHFKFNSIALRCIRCDKNDGLVMCPTCCGADSNNNNNSLSLSLAEDEREQAPRFKDENNNIALGDLEKVYDIQTQSSDA